MAKSKAAKRPVKSVVKMSSSRLSGKAAKKRRPTSVAVLPKNYTAVLEAVKARIRAAQLKAAQAVNRELVTL